MAMYAFVVPIVAGKTDAWLEFIGQLMQQRKAEYQAARRAVGLVRERAWLQRTPASDFAVVELEGPDPQKSLAAFARSDKPFDRWFRERVREVHGWDLGDTSKLPTSELHLEGTFGS